MATYMKLGVSEDIRNFSFRDGIYVVADITNTLIPTDTTASIDNSSVTLLNYKLGAGDKIKIGPSSHTLNIGVSEEVKLTTISAPTGSEYKLTFSDALTYYYKPDDEISVVSSYFPEGWSLTRDSAIITNFPLCRLKDVNLNTAWGAGNNYETGIGADDFYSFKMAFTGNGVGINLNQIISQTLDTNLLGSTYYRIGGLYKVRYLSGSSSSSSIKANLNDGSSAFAATTINSFTNTTVWTEWNSGAYQSVSNPSTSTFSFFFANLTDTSFSSVMYMDTVYIEHAKNTDDATSAVYTFTEVPILGSETWSYEKPRDFIETKSGSLKGINTSGRLAKKWTYTCRFEHVSNTFLKNLEALLQWQYEGRNLVLHTTEDYANLLPMVLVGKMRIEGITQSVWDLSKKDFTFIFEGE